MSTQPDTPAPVGRMAVTLPANLEPAYSNFALITHSPSEFVLDFAQMMPQTPQARVVARVVTTPVHAKLLLRALAENIGRFEAQFGPIATPDTSTLADHLFRPPSQGGSPGAAGSPDQGGPPVGG
jgi:hypothetical protein